MWKKSAGLITAVNPHIGYEVAARIAREAILNGKPIRELCLQYDVLSEEELNLIFGSLRNDTPRYCRCSSFRKTVNWHMLRKKGA
ncbi:hypothetical protein GCM10020331_095570 [Ectobacillus funiculus]